MPRPFRPHTTTPHTTEDAVSVCFTMPNGRYFNHTFTGLEVLALGGLNVVEAWARDVDEQIQRGPRTEPVRMRFTEWVRLSREEQNAPPAMVTETEDEASNRLAAYSQERRAELRGQSMPTRARTLDPWQAEIRDLLPHNNTLLRRVEEQITASEVAMRERMSTALFSGVTVTPSTYATSGTAYIINTAALDPLRGLTPQTFITDEVNTMPTPTPTTPNEGMPVLQEPTAYLGMPVQRTLNVRVNAVTIQATMAGRRTIYVNPNTPTGIWQEEVRRQLARLVQRSAPVSIKQTCRYCGKAYPARQGMSTDPSPYCSDRCAAAAADFTDCPACGGTGRAAGNPSGEKCGECYGSSYKPCDSCQEDHARLSLMFTNPSTGTVYYVCPACVADEREAGGVQAPQASV